MASAIVRFISNVLQLAPRAALDHRVIEQTLQERVNVLIIQWVQVRHLLQPVLIDRVNGMGEGTVLLRLLDDEVLSRLVERLSQLLLRPLIDPVTQVRPGLNVPEHRLIATHVHHVVQVHVPGTQANDTQRAVVVLTETDEALPAISDLVHPVLVVGGEWVLLKEGYGHTLGRDGDSELVQVVEATRLCPVGPGRLPASPYGATGSFPTCCAGGRGHHCGHLPARPRHSAHPGSPRPCPCLLPRDGPSVVPVVLPRLPTILP